MIHYNHNKIAKLTLKKISKYDRDTQKFNITGYEIDWNRYGGTWTLKDKDKELERSRESNCQTIAYKDNMLYFNLNNSDGGSLVFNSSGNPILKMQANIWPSSKDKQFFIYCHKSSKLNHVKIDDIKVVRNKIFEEDISCMSNNNQHSNLVYIKKSYGDFGSYNYSTRKFTKIDTDISSYESII